MIFVYLFVYLQVHYFKIYKFNHKPLSILAISTIHETHRHQKTPLDRYHNRKARTPKNLIPRKRQPQPIFTGKAHRGSWVMRYKKANGQWSWHGLGAYPLIKGARARQLYSEKLTQLADGTDLTEKPATAKTFEAIALEWYNKPAIQKLADSYKDKILQRLQVHTFPIVGNKPINDIDRQLWLKLFKQIQSKTSIKTGKPILETARRTLEICQRIYRFAIVNEFIDTSPLDYLHERLQKPTQRIWHMLA